MEKGAYVYVLYSHKDGKRYTGYTKNLRKRMQMHREGKVKSTKSRLPVELVYYEWYADESCAIRRERYLKSYYGKHYLKKRIQIQ
ncbi:MAG: GIY-YIG nuclease family protein [Bacteroidia bacterium]